MPDDRPFTSPPVEQARPDKIRPHLTLTQLQSFKLQAFLGFARLLRWLRLV